MAEIKKLLDDAIETEINNLNSASDKDEKSEVIKNLAALHKLRIEEIKTETEIEEKSERRAMDKAAHDEDATLKAFQLDENTLDRYAKIGIAAAELVLPLMFYGVWMRRGLRFEETGTFTSQTFKNLFNRFKPTLIQNAATPYPVEFAFSKDWDGFAKTALFEAGGVSMAVVLSEDKCDIPGECLKKGGIPLKIAVYGVKGEERKSTGWHVTSKILFPANISVGTGGSGDPMGDEAYKQIMGIIGDPSTAGFGNKTLTEVIVEIQRSISGTASDKEVDDMLNDAFASSDPGGSTPDNTASDKEVDDLLNDVFGEQP